MLSHRLCRKSNMFMVAVLLLLSLVKARPSQYSPSLKEPRWNNGQPNFNGYNVPLSDGTTSLPSPTGTIKAIGLGRGTQNYTCSPPTATPNTTSTTSPIPVTFGAKADLLDASPLLRFVPPEEGQRILSLIPPYILEFTIDFISQYAIPLLGHHYFNANMQPTFDLGTTGFLTAKKVGDVPAPTGSCPGQPGQLNGAVDWLKLVDAGGSVGLGEVFRVVTAGGKAPTTCPAGGGVITVQYSAVYWFYE